MTSENETVMENNQNKVYGKYRILDARTGAEKSGRYFVLKVDSSDPDERRAVHEALVAYSKCQLSAGRTGFAEDVMRYAEVR